MFDDKNVGSHKMTTDSEFILLWMIDLNTILACSEGKVYRWWGGHKIVDAEIGGSQFYWRQLFVNLEPHFRRKAPYPM